ncbi:hypothetical protein [Pedobacter sandarakinus]|uniref:hypothetical protein n=1 Tax=Pedobacter sandarakinus TaxID=353156 RepID=UPI00224848B4|nr:hypothetical protein [Pedobacter sandarakinus]MCX2573149.1 hypothetical protein [Pedobacter sandarakinus]
MKIALLLIAVIAAIVLISFGVDNINQPANLKVWIGVAEVVLGLVVVYLPLKSLFNKN